jgi:hypothetical protein
VEKLRGELDTMGVEKAMLQDLKAAVEASLVRAQRIRRAFDGLNSPCALGFSSPRGPRDNSL